MDDFKENATFTGTVNTPKLGLVSYDQVMAIAAEGQACITRKAPALSIGLTLKVEKGDISHTYKSMAEFERNYSKFDGFNRFDLRISPKYEDEADSPIVRIGVRREQSLQIDLDAAGCDETLVTACVEEFRMWLEDYINEPVTVTMRSPASAAVLPEIPVFRAALPDMDVPPAINLKPIGKETERQDAPKKKSFLRENLVEIIFVVLGLIGVYLLISNMLR